MKKTILLIATIALISCHKSTESKTQNITKDSVADTTKISQTIKLTPDSLSIVSSIADAPFDKNHHDLNYFKKKFKERTKTTNKLETNTQDNSVIDTISTIYWGKSYIKKLNNISITEPVLLEVHVFDDRFVLTNGTKIGQKAVDVFKTFKAKYSNDKDYKVLKLRSHDNEMGFINHLKIYFKNNIVSEIVYLPCID